MQKRQSCSHRDGKIHVLVADDDEMLRDLMAGLLEREGFLVSAVAGGQEAVEIVEKSEVDVGLIDVKMPDVDGIEVLKIAKKIDPQIEVVMITGYTDQEFAVQSLKNDAYAFMKKPLSDIWQIPETVRKAAEKRMMAREIIRLSGKVLTQSRLLRQKFAELRLVRKLAGRLSLGTGLEALSWHLLEAFLSVANVELCSYLISGGDSPILLVRSKRELSGKALAEAKEIAARTARELGVCQLAEGISVQYRGPQAESLLARYEVVSGVSGQRSEAVTVRGNLLGVLSIFRVGEEQINCADVRLLSALARQAARMMEPTRPPRGAEKSNVSAMARTLPPES